jgi:cysteine desulfurase/selenocysteine lyase
MTTPVLRPELPAGLAPPGLPDVATLARLAGEFFAALPGAPPSGLAGSLPLQSAPPAVGGVPVPVQLQPPGLSLPAGAAGPSTPAAVPLGAIPPGANLVPNSPQSPANGLASAPALVPHAPAPNGVPDHALMAAPGHDGRYGSHVLSVPGAGTTERSYTAAAGPATAPLRVPGGPDFGAGGVPDLGLARSHTLPPGAAAQSFYFLDAGAAPQTRPGPHGSPHGVPAPSATPAPQAHFDVHAVRRDFPILQERVNGRQLVWFDNAATTQKPRAVIDRLKHFYEHENSNIHRAAHELAARATDAYEGARETVRRFIGAAGSDEVIFVRGATEAINLVAKSWGAQHIGPGDEIIVSHLEHHANIVPWQQLAAEKGATIKVIPVDDSGQVLLDAYRRLLSPRTRIVAVTQVSNALGTVVPVKQIVDLAHAAGALALVDGAQSVSHLRVNVVALDADFFVFSGHKVFGPTGIGALYAKRALLDDMPPWQGGGNMIADVTFERTVYQPPPNKFEAGTGNIADAVGLGAALEYVERIGIEAIAAYEHGLLDYATHRLRPIPGVRLVGTAADKASVLSFVLDGTATDAVGRALNDEGIAVRTGHHCAQPILRRFGLEATVRPSLAFYNTCEEVDRFIAVVQRLAHRR